MLNDVTLRNFEDRFQLVQSKANDIVHCTLYIVQCTICTLCNESQPLSSVWIAVQQQIHWWRWPFNVAINPFRAQESRHGIPHKNQDTDSHTKNSKFALSSSVLQTLPVPGRSGACGQFVNPVWPIARSSDSATATTLLRLLPVLANQLRRLLAQSLLTQLASTGCCSSICMFVLYSPLARRCTRPNFWRGVVLSGDALRRTSTLSSFCKREIGQIGFEGQNILSKMVNAHS